MKQHPLSPYALGWLKALARADQCALEINNGAVDKLLRDKLAVMVDRPSPYKIDKGGNRPFLAITPAGRKFLEGK